MTLSPARGSHAAGWFTRHNAATGRGRRLHMLDGTTDKQDARLLADIEAAPDPFDGGCAADVAATPAHETVREFHLKSIDRAHLIGRKQGIYDVIAWLRATDGDKMADWISSNCDEIERFLDDLAARGE